MPANCLPETSPELALSLRCREAEWIDADSTLTDFARPVPRSAQPAQGAVGLVEALVADRVARQFFGLQGTLARQFISCELARFEIPVGPQPLVPPTADWNHREELAAELLPSAEEVEASGLVAMAVRIRRGMVIAASVLPLALAPTLAHAGEGGVEGPAPAPAADAADTDAPAQPETPATTEAPTMAPAEAAPAPTAPAPRVTGSSLSLTSRAVWDGLSHKRVTLDMKNGQTLSGVVVAQSDRQIALARASDGTIVAVPKADVGGVRVKPTAGAGASKSAGGGDELPKTRESGRGMVVGGAIMLGFGGVAALAGTVLLATSPYTFYVALPLLLPGAATVIGGVVLVRGAKKKRALYNKAWGLPDMSKVELMPTINVGRNGGQAGLVLRF